MSLLLMSNIPDIPNIPSVNKSTMKHRLRDTTLSKKVLDVRSVWDVWDVKGVTQRICQFINHTKKSFLFLYILQTK